MHVIEIISKLPSGFGWIYFVIGAVTAWTYNIFLHPLRTFPGPLLARASRLPFIYHNLRGTSTFWITDIHKKYGEAVRFSPNELDFSAADAWKDIHGHKTRGQAEFIKNPRMYTAPRLTNDPPAHDILNAPGAAHARLRRIFSNAFSDRALKSQEALFLDFIEKMIKKLSTLIAEHPTEKINIVKLYNLTTFDIMSDLTFGQPLNLIENWDYHPWVSTLFSGLKLGVVLQSIRYFSGLEQLVISILPKVAPDTIATGKSQRDFVHAQVDQRMSKAESRPDIWSLVIDKTSQNAELALTRTEMYVNANIFMIAGSETTATLLSGLTYYLLRNPDKMKRLVEEIRARESEEDLTLERLQALSYLNACLEEGLRMYPPVLAGLSRITPDGGATVAGYHVPGGTCVSITHFAAYRNPNNFRDPYDFMPERWLDDKYSSDKKHALQPFSTGPRNCIGKNMAYHEMRLILARILWNFDLKLCPESKGWDRQLAFILWDKKDLMLQLSPAVRSRPVATVT